MKNRFLPVSKEDMKERKIEQLDFVYVTGDAYVDHPSFGHAIIGRLLESRGYTVGMIPQPDWKTKESVMALGRPRLGFLVSGGNMDSMVNHYSVSKKHRQKDSYTPGGEMGRRPDYAVVVYCNLIRFCAHGLRSRSDFLRHGRAFDRRDCRRSAGGDRSEGYHLCQRDML